MPRRLNSTRLRRSPQELRDAFFRLRNREDLARLLDLDVKQLNYHLYVVPPEKRYKEFWIPKRMGGTRRILAPVSPIKIIQRKLGQVLEAVYLPKPSTHGFVKGRSILTNAGAHKKRRYVLNLDLKDFFPTIHFGRVRGMFMARPYSLNNEVATLLAQICCHEGTLPQGAPTSPVISNMICARLDAKLQQLAKANHSTYTRYADDLTFSTAWYPFPSAIGGGLSGIAATAGDDLTNVIHENGFKINPMKTRLRPKTKRQEVTGLTVNKFPNVTRRYVRQVRAILHAWSKYGEDSTATNYFDHHAPLKYQARDVHRPQFRRVIGGKIEFIGMVKGKMSPVYLGLLRAFQAMAPDYVRYVHAIPRQSLTSLVIYAEGKTDPKHLQAALRGLQLAGGPYAQLAIEFPQGPDSGGDQQLLQRLRNLSEDPTQRTRAVVGIFDRDSDNVIAQVTSVGSYRAWTNGVYSLALPIPKHREGLNHVCIELYYKDEAIKQPDASGRRLYLSSEFARNGMHLDGSGLVWRGAATARQELHIVTDPVLDEKGHNVALPKDDFAENILMRRPGFDRIDFSGFRALFDQLLQIGADFVGEGRKPPAPPSDTHKTTSH